VSRLSNVEREFGERDPCARAPPGRSLGPLLSREDVSGTRFLGFETTPLGMGREAIGWRAKWFALMCSCVSW